MYKFNDKSIDKKNNTATFGAGISLYDLLKFLDKNGYILENRSAISVQSIGGCIATGTHGSRALNHTSSISDALLNCNIVDGNGNLHSITDKKELKAFKTHLGYLGVVYNVTLKIVPQFNVNYSFNELNKLDYNVVKNIINNNYSTNIYFFNKNQYYVDNYNKTTKAITSNTNHDTIFETVLFKLLNPFLKINYLKPIITLFSENMFNNKNDKIGKYYEIYGVNFNKFPITNWQDYEIAFRFEENIFNNVINEIYNIFKNPKNGINFFTLRFGGSDNSYLGMNSKYDVFWINITNLGSGHPQKSIEESLKVIQKYKGRPHYGKAPIITLDILENADLNVKKWLKIKEKYDPNKIFYNKTYEEMFLK